MLKLRPSRIPTQHNVSKIQSENQALGYQNKALQMPFRKIYAVLEMSDYVQNSHDVQL